MTRYFIEMAFKGTDFHGWQAQPNAKSVQSELEHAIELITGEEIKVTGAGRTDTGVHAEFYSAHFDLEKNVLPKGDFVYKLNAVLPESIAIRDIYPVVPNAHARFSAVSRSYRYTIRQKKDPFTPDLTWYYATSLDMDLMRKAAVIILNNRDFSSFCKLHSDVKNHLCEIYDANWYHLDDKLVFEICANRFLRNMVRAIVGTMIEIGKGKISLSDLEKIIAGKNRRLAGFSVPAQGLSLFEVKYPDDIKLNETFIH